MGRAELFAELQQLLTQGQFTSSYKLALLVAMVRWAVENPHRTEEQEVDVAEFVPHYVEVYWPQVRPFAVAPGPGVGEPPLASAFRGSWAADVLLQDAGGQDSRVLRLIRQLQEAGINKPSDLRPEDRAGFEREVRASIADMPLWRLQVVDGQRREFLYRQGSTRRAVVFQPGVVEWFAAFAPLIEQLVKASWIRLVLRWNARTLGARPAELEAFLFPEGRESLAAWREALLACGSPTCFYCEEDGRDLVVDHFLPWSRYGRDLGHNFVLAHARCNGHKSDHLASAHHLRRWCERNHHARDLEAAFDQRALPHDWSVLRRATEAHYRIAADVDARVWHRGRDLVRLEPEWVQAFASEAG